MSGPPTVPVSVGLYAHQLDALDYLAQMHGATRSDLVRKALAAWGPLRAVLDGELDRSNGGG